MTEYCGGGGGGGGDMKCESEREEYTYNSLPCSMDSI